MPKKAIGRRDQLISRIADLLLKERVALLPLRDLAARLNTSDRMLLYYFENQETLVRASLTHLSHALELRLGTALPEARLPPAALLKRLLVLIADPAIAPALGVWADVAARGVRGEQPFADFAQASAKAWLAWIDRRLDVTQRARRQKIAAVLLIVIEGTRSLGLVAPAVADDATPLLVKAFDLGRD